MLCISDHLLCDGFPNCPKSSTNSDEDPKLCNTAKNAWENLVVELVKKYRTHDPRLKINSTDVPSEWFVEWQLGNKNGMTLRKMLLKIKLKHNLLSSYY